MSNHPPFKKNYNLRKSFGFALEGLWYSMKWERNFRIHLAAAAFVLYFSQRYYSLSSMEMGLLVFAIVLVLTTEMVNTAIERTIDLLSPDYNSLAKIAKDVAAGAVFVSAAGALSVGLLLLGDFSTLQLIFRDVLGTLYIWIPIVILALTVIFLPEYRQKTKASTTGKR